MLPKSQFVRATLFFNSMINFTSTITSQKTTGGILTIELEIDNGWIKGVKKLSRNFQRRYYYFRGIPYAEQPVGHLRFEPPIPATSWRPSVLDATRYSPFCLQFPNLNLEFIQSERCLFLNVAVPKKVLPKKTKYNDNEAPKLVYPVIVHIHGGGFREGFSNLFNPSHFMDEDVVFVSMNYRIGFFGFLNTGDDVVRGNMGLKDQTLALKWVQENIEYFGGDPNRVIIMGESAGGTSTHLHLLSPMSRGLFHRAISHSGVANYFSFIENPRKGAIKLGRKLRCPTSNTREMVTCLKSIPAKDLNKINQVRGRIDKFLTGQLLQFGPSVEAVQDSNTFLFDKPSNLIRQGLVTTVPWIVGLNTNEILPFALIVVQNETITKALNREWNHYAPLMLGYKGHPKADDISTAIRHKYLGERKISRATVREFSLILSDRFFVEGIYDAIHSHARINPVYACYFTYMGEFTIASYVSSIPSWLPRPINIFYSIVKNWFINLVKISTEKLDGGHGDEIPLFFPFFSRRILPGHKDYLMSKEVIKVWTHFASTGKPGKIFGVEWAPVLMSNQFKSEEYRYLKLDSKPMMIPDPFTSRIQFWKSLNLDFDFNNNEGQRSRSPNEVPQIGYI